MKKREEILAKRALKGFARHGITGVQFGRKVARLKNGQVEIGYRELDVETVEGQRVIKNAELLEVSIIKKGRRK